MEFLLWRPRNEAFSSLHASGLGTRLCEENGTENSLVCAESNMAENQSFEVRKQHLLTSYFGLSSTEELKNNLVNYQHTSTSLTIDYAAIVNCRFRFVAAYIDV